MGRSLGSLGSFLRIAFRGVGALTLGGLLVVPTPARGANLSVHPDGTGPYPSIQAAIDAARGGDTITLSDGVYTGPGNFNIDLRGKAITVASTSGDPRACVIDCEVDLATVDHLGHVRHWLEDADGVRLIRATYWQPDTTLNRRGFIFRRGESRNTQLRGIGIRNGVGADGGGAILCRNASRPTIRRCRFEGCAASDGGAVACRQDAAPRFEICEFVGNVSVPRRVLSGSGCRAPIADGIHCFQARIELRDCLFFAHRAFCQGSLLSLDEARADLEHCTFHSEAGAAVASIDTTGFRPALISMLFSDAYFRESILSCPQQRPTIWCGDPEHAPRFTNCCILGSWSVATPPSGQGYWNPAGLSWGQTPPEPEPVLVAAGPPTQIGQNGNFAADPGFVDPAAGDLRLREDSPCRAGTEQNPGSRALGAGPP